MSVAAQEVVVDVGCGVGRLTRVLAERAREVWALDVSQEMLAQARQLHDDLHRVHWIHGDGRTLTGIPSAVAGGCVSHVVFQHIPEPEVTSPTCARWAGPCGPEAGPPSKSPTTRRCTRPTRAALAGARALVRRGPCGQSDPAWLGSAIDLGDLRRAAQDGGMVVERVEGTGTQFCAVLARRGLRLTRGSRGSV